MSALATPQYPRIVVVLSSQGCGTVRIDNAMHRVVGTSLPDGQRKAIGLIQVLAAQHLGRAVRVDTHGPDGAYQLLVSPNGAVELAPHGAAPTSLTPTAPQQVDDQPDRRGIPRQGAASASQLALAGGVTLLATVGLVTAASGHMGRRVSEIDLTSATATTSPTSTQTPSAVPTPSTPALQSPTTAAADTLETTTTPGPRPSTAPTLSTSSVTSTEPAALGASAAPITAQSAASSPAASAPAPSASTPATTGGAAAGGPIHATLDIEATGPVHATLTIEADGQVQVQQLSPATQDGAAPSSAAPTIKITPRAATSSAATPAGDAPKATSDSTAAPSTSTAAPPNASPTQAPTAAPQPTASDEDDPELEAANQAMTQATLNALAEPQTSSPAATSTQSTAPAPSSTPTSSTATTTVSPTAAGTASTSPTTSPTTSPATTSGPQAPTADPTGQASIPASSSMPGPTPAAASSATAPTAVPTSDTPTDPGSAVPSPADSLAQDHGQQPGTAAATADPAGQTQSTTAATATTGSTATGAVPAGADSTGGWLSGAAGDGVTDGSLGAWRGKPLAIAGTWDDSGDAQTQMWDLGPGGEYGDWNKPIDLASGGFNPGDNWSAAASGAYDDRWRQGLQQAAQYRAGKGTTYIRPFHEFNGDWYPWSVHPGQEADFITAWKRYRAIQQQVFPSAKLVYNVNVNSTAGLDWRKTWPGADQADVLGVDLYNGSPQRYDSAQAWDSALDATGDGGIPIGLNAYAAQAKAWGVPLAVPEWSGRAEQGDDPAFITGIGAWFAQHAGTGPGQLLYEVMFNVNRDGDNFRLFQGTRMPQSAEAYREAFSQPASNGDSQAVTTAASRSVATTEGPAATRTAAPSDEPAEGPRQNSSQSDGGSNGGDGSASSGDVNATAGFENRQSADDGT